MGELIVKTLNMNYRELENKVELWAEEKGILKKSSPADQCEKTMEEVDELMQAIEDNDQEEIKDALGDILVTIIIQAKLQNMDLLQCLESAYEIISKRKGKMIDGKFVKNN